MASSTGVVIEGPMVTPGQKADGVPHNFSETVKAICIKAYKKAYDKRREDFKAMQTTLQSHGTKFGGPHAAALTGGVTASLAARENEVQKVLDYTNENYTDFFSTDLAIFHERDVDSSGFLEKKEFIPLLESEDNFGMTADEAKETMEHWDVDESNSIGPFEWAAFCAVKRAEMAYCVEKNKTDVLIAAMDQTIPGAKGCCPSCCLPCLGPCAVCCICWGTAFACCTCGLSLCIPVCCLCLVGAAASEGAPQLKIDLVEAELKGEKEGKQQAKKIIMEGPKDDAKSGVKKWQRESMGEYKKGST
jgi:hypothetical protein